MLFYFVSYVQMKGGGNGTNTEITIRPPEAKWLRNCGGLKSAAALLLLMLGAKAYGQGPMRGDTTTAIVQTFEEKLPWAQVIAELKEDASFFPDTLGENHLNTPLATPSDGSLQRGDTEPVISGTDLFANDINTILEDIGLEDYISIPLASDTLTLETAISVNGGPAVPLGTLIDPNSATTYGEFLTREEAKKIIGGFLLYETNYPNKVIEQILASLGQ